VRTSVSLCCAALGTQFLFIVVSLFRSTLLLLMLTFVSAGAFAQQSLRLMANTSPPYADEKLPQRGLALELVEHVFARTGITPVITIENWSRALEGARLGVYDGLAAAWYSDERAQDLLFSKPYLSSRLIILQRRDNQGRYDDLRDLAGARLGVRAEYAYGVDLESVPGLVLVQENHLIQNLLNLLNGRVDFVIGDQRTINQQLHEYLKDKISQFTVSAIDLPPVARHVAVSRSLEGHEKIVADFNAALEEAEKDGSKSALIGKWDDLYSGK